MNINFKKILSNGVTITSSGTTGDPKKIFRSPKNLAASIKIALESQEITKKSSIYTVTRTTHAGGLLLQTLPAYTLGCEIKIETFNPYTFLREFKNFTHTFLAPAQMTALMNTKDFKNADLTGKRILGGSDPVSWDMIEAFVSKGAIVQPNWGMSEIGPCTINSVFKTLEDVELIKKHNNNETILGNIFWCDWKIENGELFVKSDMCVYEGWFNTRDQVSATYSIDTGVVLNYKGRISNV
jgi:acyl-CoA synthetase (AMP-forming)/AMP-acid ligase II